MKNIFYNILKTILIIFGFSYLVNELYKNYEKVIIELDLNILIILFIVRLIHLNLISIRNFQFLKICTLYKDKIFDYSLIFFKSLVMNLTFNHAGTAYRAVELKKKEYCIKIF